jgi:hypothetical protein
MRPVERRVRRGARLRSTVTKNKENNMGQRMMVFRNTILVNQFDYPGEDNDEMLSRMKSDWETYTSEVDAELGDAEWTCTCTHFD